MKQQHSSKIHTWVCGQEFSLSPWIQMFFEMFHVFLRSLAYDHLNNKHNQYFEKNYKTLLKPVWNQNMLVNIIY